MLQVKNRKCHYCHEEVLCLESVTAPNDPRSKYTVHQECLIKVIDKVLGRPYEQMFDDIGTLSEAMLKITHRLNALEYKQKKDME